MEGRLLAMTNRAEKSHTVGLIGEAATAHGVSHQCEGDLMSSRLIFSPILSALADFDHKLVIEGAQEHLDDLPYIQVSYEPGIDSRSYEEDMPDLLKEIWEKHNQRPAPPIVTRTAGRIELFKIFINPSVSEECLDLRLWRGEHGFAYMAKALKDNKISEGEKSYEDLEEIIKASIELPRWDSMAAAYSKNIKSIRIIIDALSAEDLPRHCERASSIPEGLVLACRGVR